MIQSFFDQHKPVLPDPGRHLRDTPAQTKGGGADTVSPGKGDMQSDPFKIGQEAVLRIRMSVAMAGMGDAVEDAFTSAYVPPEWQAMKRRLFYRFREQYEAAKAELEALQNPALSVAA